MKAVLSAVCPYRFRPSKTPSTSVPTTELLVREVRKMEVMQMSCDHSEIVQSLLLLMLCGCCAVSVHWEVLELLEVRS